MTTEEIQKILPQCNVSNIKTHSKEWFIHRNKFVNSSELGIIAGVTKYGSPRKLYYEKLGLTQPNEQNQFTFLGSYFENNIKDLWQYFSGEVESYIKNYSEGRKIRGFIDIDCYLSNSKYPWLSGSVDGLIDKDAYHALNLVTMDKLEDYGILECKRMSTWVDRAYDGLPPGYLLQVQSYLLITGLEYAEIAILKETGLHIEVVLADKGVQDHILAVSKGYYDNCLVPGFKALKVYQEGLARDDMDMIEDGLAQIQSHEPDGLDSSEDYKIFISDTFQKEREFVQAPDEVFEIARESIMIKKVINALETRRKGLNGNISREHNRAGSEYLSFGKENEFGYTRFYTKGSNKRNELNLRLKEQPDEQLIANEIKKLNLTY